MKNIIPILLVSSLISFPVFSVDGSHQDSQPTRRSPGGREVRAAQADDLPTGAIVAYRSVCTDNGGKDWDYHVKGQTAGDGAARYIFECHFGADPRMGKIERKTLSDNLDGKATRAVDTFFNRTEKSCTDLVPGKCCTNNGGTYVKLTIRVQDDKQNDLPTYCRFKDGSAIELMTLWGGAQARGNQKLVEILRRR